MGSFFFVQVEELRAQCGDFLETITVSFLNSILKIDLQKSNTFSSLDGWKLPKRSLDQSIIFYPYSIFPFCIEFVLCILSCWKADTWMYVQVNVTTLAKGSVKERELEIIQTARIADHLLSIGRDTLIMTSRELVTGSSKSSLKPLDEYNKRHTIFMAFNHDIFIHGISGLLFIFGR